MNSPDEATRRLDEWANDARLRIAAATLQAEAKTSGCVEHVSDGIARVSGLQDIGLNEWVHFEGGQDGLALSLEKDWVSVVIFNDASTVKSGDTVEGTGKVITIPVGESLLGRVINPQGKALDNKEPVKETEFRGAECPGPAIIDRELVNESVQTGVLVVDALFALGRGQRELIIGDKGTGKTALAVDAIINQKNTDMICIYVAIGQRSSDVERTIESLRQHGAMDRCIVVVAGPADSQGMQWLAPFAGMSMAEYFRDKAKHVLIVLDDLSHHAVTHRELALLTDQPPGREAYPGDIFYVHARLLERAARLSEKHGGGSITALPIAETQAGNLSAYIPTNLISITDGQIVLDSHLFASGQRPAVNVGLSVSRIGGKAQDKILRRVSGRLRLEYAQFLELEAFTRFGGLTDERVKARVGRGQHIRALLSQSRFFSLRRIDQIALLAALESDLLDQLSIEDINTLKQQISEHLNNHVPHLVQRSHSAELLHTQELEELLATIGTLIAQYCPSSASTSS